MPVQFSSLKLRCDVSIDYIYDVFSYESLLRNSLLRLCFSEMICIDYWVNKL
jgi:hypothetical protein